MTFLRRPRPSARSRWVPAVLLGLSLAACAGRGPLRVSPEEIPQLEVRLQESPNDAALRMRYAAALFAAGRCRDARVQAEGAAALRPDNGVTPLIQGQCLEAEGRLAQAVDVYAAYLRQHPDAEGADAVRGRHLLAARALAQTAAQEALAREAELDALPAEAGVIAVLPVAVVGDPEGRWASLSRALAQMLISDLSLLDRLRMVERLRLQALLDEMALGESGRVEAATAARVGRLVRAEELVQGTLVLDRDHARLEADVVDARGVRSGADPATGGIRDLLALEKRLALSLADRLAGPLTPAEERRILDNGPRSVDAFLEWADGLILEDRGDYVAASAAYRAAARLDPGFTDARDRARRTASAVTVIGRSPTEVVGLGQRAASAASDVGDPLLGRTLDGAILDAAPLGPEVAVGFVPGAAVPQTPGASQPTPALPVDVILRVLVRIPR